MLPRDEFRAVFEDIKSLHILHGDIALRNFLRAPDGADSTVKVCPKHQRQHRWFFVDWEEGFVVLDPRKDFANDDWRTFTDYIKYKERERRKWRRSGSTP